MENPQLHGCYGQKHIWVIENNDALKYGDVSFSDNALCRLIKVYNVYVRFCVIN